MIRSKVGFFQRQKIFSCWLCWRRTTQSPVHWCCQRHQEMLVTCFGSSGFFVPRRQQSTSHKSSWPPLGPTDSRRPTEVKKVDSQQHLSVSRHVNCLLCNTPRGGQCTSSAFFIKSENQMLWAQNWLITNIIWFLLCNSHFHSKYCFVFEPMKDVDFLSGTVTQKQQITQMYHSTSWKLLRDLKLLLAYFSVISIVFNIQKSCCQNVHYSSFFILIRFRI